MSKRSNPHRYVLGLHLCLFFVAPLNGHRHRVAFKLQRHHFSPGGVARFHGTMITADTFAALGVHRCQRVCRVCQAVPGLAPCFIFAGF